MLRGGAVVVSLVMTASLLAPWLAPYPPDEQLDVAMSRHRPPGTVLQAVELSSGVWRLTREVERVPGGLRIERLGRQEILPAEEVENLTSDGVADRRVYLLGTDGIGRDLLSRMLHGGRVSLAIGLVAVALALSVGVAVGSLAALGGPRLDAVLMRGVDALLAFPALVLLLALSSLFQPGIGVMMAILGGTSWMVISRLMRAEILGLEQREFVLAARAAGMSPLAIWLRHLLPNAWVPVAIQATLLFVDVILAEAALSFLRMGVPPPTPTWGNMVAEGRPDLVHAWWISAFPGLAIAVTVIAFNLLADGLRDALDPHRS